MFLGVFYISYSFSSEGAPNSAHTSFSSITILCFRTPTSHVVNTIHKMLYTEIWVLKFPHILTVYFHKRDISVPGGVFSSILILACKLKWECLGKVQSKEGTKMPTPRRAPMALKETYERGYMSFIKACYFKIFITPYWRYTTKLLNLLSAEKFIWLPKFTFISNTIKIFTIIGTYSFSTT